MKTSRLYIKPPENKYQTAYLVTKYMQKEFVNILSSNWRLELDVKIDITGADVEESTKVLLRTYRQKEGALHWKRTSETDMTSLFHVSITEICAHIHAILSQHSEIHTDMFVGSNNSNALVNPNARSDDVVIDTPWHAEE